MPFPYIFFGKRLNKVIFRGRNISCRPPDACFFYRQAEPRCRLIEECRRGMRLPDRETGLLETDEDCGRYLPENFPGRMIIAFGVAIAAGTLLGLWRTCFTLVGDLWRQAVRLLMNP